jgi:uncharacterized membrane protein YhfC
MDSLVVATFAVVALLEIAVPLTLGYWVVRRFGVPWRVFGLGALFFVVVQVIHTPLVLVTQVPLSRALLPFGTIVPLALYLGLLAGLFEEVGRYLVYRYYFRRRDIPLTREVGLQFGAGWGGVESIIVALLVISSMITYIALASNGVVPLPDDPTVMAQIAALRSLTPLDILPSLAERMMTITLHIAWSLMVLAAVVYERKAFLILAILWHAAVDAVAVYLVQTQGVLVTEAVIFIFAIAGLVYIFTQWRRMRERPVS